MICLLVWFNVRGEHESPTSQLYWFDLMFRPSPWFWIVWNCIKEHANTKKLLTYLYGKYVYKNLLYLYGSGKVEWKVFWYLNGHLTKKKQNMLIGLLKPITKYEHFNILQHEIDLLKHVAQEKDIQSAV
jgi:hypothetical protein